MEKNLFQIIFILRTHCHFFSPGHCWQKQASQNADDGNYHQKLNQSERAICFHIFFHSELHLTSDAFQFQVLILNIFQPMPERYLSLVQFNS